MDADEQNIQNPIQSAPISEQQDDDHQPNMTSRQPEGDVDAVTADPHAQPPAASQAALEPRTIDVDLAEEEKQPPHSTTAGQETSFSASTPQIDSEDANPEKDDGEVPLNDETQNPFNSLNDDAIVDSSDNPQVPPGSPPPVRNETIDLTSSPAPNDDVQPEYPQDEQKPSGEVIAIPDDEMGVLRASQTVKTEEPDEHEQASMEKELPETTEQQQKHEENKHVQDLEKEHQHQPSESKEIQMDNSESENATEFDGTTDEMIHKDNNGEEEDLGSTLDKDVNNLTDLDKQDIEQVMVISDATPAAEVPDDTKQDTQNDADSTENTDQQTFVFSAAPEALEPETDSAPQPTSLQDQPEALTLGEDTSENEEAVVLESDEYGEESQTKIEHMDTEPMPTTDSKADIEDDQKLLQDEVSPTTIENNVDIESTSKNSKSQNEDEQGTEDQVESTPKTSNVGESIVAAADMTDADESNEAKNSENDVMDTPMRGAETSNEGANTNVTDVPPKFTEETTQEQKDEAPKRPVLVEVDEQESIPHTPVDIVQPLEENKGSGEEKTINFGVNDGENDESITKTDTEKPEALIPKIDESESTISESKVSGTSTAEVIKETDVAMSENNGQDTPSSSNEEVEGSASNDQTEMSSDSTNNTNNALTVEMTTEHETTTSEADDLNMEESKPPIQSPDLVTEMDTVKSDQPSKVSADPSPKSMGTDSKTDDNQEGPTDDSDKKEKNAVKSALAKDSGVATGEAKKHSKRVTFSDKAEEFIISPENSENPARTPEIGNASIASTPVPTETPSTKEEEADPHAEQEVTETKTPEGHRRVEVINVTLSVKTKKDTVPKRRSSIFRVRLIIRPGNASVFEILNSNDPNSGCWAVLSPVNGVINIRKVRKPPYVMSVIVYGDTNGKMTEKTRLYIHLHRHSYEKLFPLCEYYLMQVPASRPRTGIAPIVPSIEVDSKDVTGFDKNASNISKDSSSGTSRNTVPASSKSTVIGSFGTKSSEADKKSALPDPILRTSGLKRYAESGISKGTLDEGTKKAKMDISSSSIEEKKKLNHQILLDKRNQLLAKFGKTPGRERAGLTRLTAKADESKKLVPEEPKTKAVTEGNETNMSLKNTPSSDSQASSLPKITSTPRESSSGIASGLPKAKSTWGVRGTPNLRSSFKPSSRIPSTSSSSSVRPRSSILKTVKMKTPPSNDGADVMKDINKDESLKNQALGNEKQIVDEVERRLLSLKTEWESNALKSSEKEKVVYQEKRQSDISTIISWALSNIVESELDKPSSQSNDTLPSLQRAEPDNVYDFFDRLHTFRPSTWVEFGAPSEIDAMECALRGWHNSGTDRLKSSEGAEIVANRNALLHPEKRTAEVQRIRELIEGKGHKLLSKWIGQSCPHEFREAEGSARVNDEFWALFRNNNKDNTRQFSVSQEIIS